MNKTSGLLKELLILLTLVTIAPNFASAAGTPCEGGSALNLTADFTGSGQSIYSTFDEPAAWWESFTATGDIANVDLDTCSEIGFTLSTGDSPMVVHETASDLVSLVIGVEWTASGLPWTGHFLIQDVPNFTFEGLTGTAPTATESKFTLTNDGQRIQFTYWFDVTAGFSFTGFHGYIPVSGLSNLNSHTYNFSLNNFDFVWSTSDVTGRTLIVNFGGKPVVN